jgi:hypothetical protein
MSVAVSINVIINFTFDSRNSLDEVIKETKTKLHTKMDKDEAMQLLSQLDKKNEGLLHTKMDKDEAMQLLSQLDKKSESLFQMKANKSEIEALSQFRHDSYAGCSANIIQDLSAESIASPAILPHVPTPPHGLSSSFILQPTPPSSSQLGANLVQLVNESLFTASPHPNDAANSTTSAIPNSGKGRNSNLSTFQSTLANVNRSLDIESILNSLQMRIASLEREYTSFKPKTLEMSLRYLQNDLLDIKSQLNEKISLTDIRDDSICTHSRIKTDGNDYENQLLELHNELMDLKMMFSTMKQDFLSFKSQMLERLQHDNKFTQITPSFVAKSAATKTSNADIELQLEILKYEQEQCVKKETMERFMQSLTKKIDQIESLQKVMSCNSYPASPLHP